MNYQSHVRIGYAKPIFIILSLIFTQTISAQPNGFVDQQFLTGFDQIVGFTWDDAGNNLYVWEKNGKVKVVQNGVTLPTPLLDIEEEVGGWRDFGLLGFALDPNFLVNGYFYIHYLVDRHYLLNFGTPSYDPNTNEYFDASIGRVTRYQADAATGFTTLVPNSRFILLGETKETGEPHLHESHGIGQIVFGTDGTLMVAMGDGASYSSTDEGSASETYWQQALTDGIITPAENIGAYRCQLPSSLNGKILRIDPVTGDGIPSNPFYDSNNPRSAESRTWSLGVRNPYRMTKRPNTGSHDPADADPGTFYFGDVGWGLWEDLNVIDAPGQNFGWPKYEGITHMPGYNNATYEPAVHERPRIDFRHGQDVARGIVNGQMVTVGSATLPGNQFRGNASTGGIWYTGTDFPLEYQNTYFHADYSSGWIRNFAFDGINNPLEVNEFQNSAGPVVYLNTHPTTGSLYYVRYPNQIRKISYTGVFNSPPTASASADILNGASPLTVNFTGDQSFDPDFDNLTYSWDFGDGNFSSDANPTHTFSNGNIVGYTVTLTVSDGQFSDQATLNISLNNTAPVIISTSIDGVSDFSVTNATNLSLSASVADAEHTNGQLTYQWGVELHHNDHFHSESSVNSPNTVTTLTPVGCNGATYWYRIRLTVTDPVGASAVYEKDLFPNCTGNSQTITFPPVTDKFINDAPFALNATTTSGLPITYYVKEGPAVVTGNTINLTGIPGVVTVVATQHGNTTFAVAVPKERSFNVSIPSGGVCSGSGTISREVWTGITGTAVNQIPVNTTPDIEDELTIFEIPVNVLDNYGTRLRGYICAPTTGQYTFWIASDDNGELWLSTNADPANKTLIANVPSWSSSQEWDKFPEQMSAPITLIGGQTYYIEALQKEGTGGDNLAVGWQLPSGTLERPIPGSRLSPFNGQPPVAAFTATPLTGNVPLFVNFNASTSSDPDGTIANYNWDFGDGSSASGVNVSHTYNNMGDYTVVLTITDNDGNTAQNSTIISVTQGAQNQTINFSSIDDKNTTDTPFQISATASSGLPVSFSIVSGPATISGNILTLNGAIGTVVVRASQLGNAQYNPAPDVEQSFNVTQLSSGEIDLELSMSTSNNEPTQWSNFTVTTSLTNAGNAPAAGVQVSFPLPDGVVFVGGNASNASQGSYDAFNSQSWTVGTLAAGETATLELNFFLLTTNPVISYTEVTAANETDIDSTPNNGSCCTANEDDEALLTVPMVGPQNQTITFPSIANKESDEPPFNLNATASSGLSVNYTLISGPATIAGNTVTLTGALGTVVIEATQLGNTMWNPAPPVQRSFQIIQPGLMNQTIAFSPIPNKQTDAPPFQIFATASSGLPVTFTHVSGPATISGNTVTLTGTTGTVTIRASQAGNGQFNPAPDVEQSFNVTLPAGEGDIDLALSFTTSNATPTQWSNFTITATLTNDGPMTASNVEVSLPSPNGVVFQGGNEFTASTGSFSNNGNQVWVVGNLAANATETIELNYFLLTADPVTSFGQVINAPEIDADSTPDNGTCCVSNEDDEAVLIVPNVGPQNQTINFPAIVDKESDDQPFDVSATASSGLPVNFAIESGPAAIIGNTITLNGTIGSVTVKASQTGNANFNAAPDVLRTFQVNTPGLMNQTINFPNIPNKMDTDQPFNISATATSGLPVSFVIESGPATIAGNTITLNGNTGTVVVRAIQVGNSTYNPAPDVTQSFTVSGPVGNDEIDLALSISANNNTIQIWNNVIFTLTITNNGNVTANNLEIAAPILTGLAYTSSSASAGSYNLFTQNWDLPSLAVGATETLDLVIFNLQDSNPVNFYVQVVAADETDSDSTPNNNAGPTPSEDDEALAVVNPPSSALLSDNHDIFTMRAKRKGSSVQIRWFCNMGFDADQYILEKSADAIHFEELKIRPNEEFNDNVATYRELDFHPNTGANYYRVKVILNDGREEYTNIQLIDFEDSAQRFLLFPNPNDGAFKIDLKSVAGKEVVLKVFDRNGVQVWQEMIEEASVYPHKVEIEGLRDGTLFLWIQVEGRRPIVREFFVGR